MAGYPNHKIRHVVLGLWSPPKEGAMWVVRVDVGREVCNTRGVEDRGEAGDCAGCVRGSAVGGREEVTGTTTTPFITRVPGGSAFALARLRK